MSAELQKWILEFRDDQNSKLDSSQSKQRETKLDLLYSMLPGSILDSELFIHSENWLPIKVSTSYNLIQQVGDDQSSEEPYILNIISFSIVATIATLVESNLASAGLPILTIASLFDHMCSIVSNSMDQWYKKEGRSSKLTSKMEELLTWSIDLMAKHPASLVPPLANHIVSAWIFIIIRRPGDFKQTIQLLSTKINRIFLLSSLITFAAQFPSTVGLPSKNPKFIHLFDSFSVTLERYHLITFTKDWLEEQTELNSLKEVLTQVEEEKHMKPKIDKLEIGFDIMHLISQKILELKEKTDILKPIPAQQTKDEDLEEIHAFQTCENYAKTFNQLISVVLKDLEVPDYFYYLKETKEFDKKNYSFAHFRVKTFHALVGHYWILLDALLSILPHLDWITLENPDSIVPEGVEKFPETPLWSDLFLFTIAVHSMKSDFFSVTSSQLALKCFNSFIHNPQFEQLQPKHIYLLRYRQAVSFVKSKTNLDDKARFSAILWLCSVLPIRELKVEYPLDLSIATLLVDITLESLNNYRTPIKMMGIQLVNAICSEGTSAAQLLPKSVFDAIAKSLNFREKDLISQCLRVCKLLIESHPTTSVQIHWTVDLMNTINYEMDYIQQPDLLIIYVEQLIHILPFLKSKIITFLHPLFVRTVALFDVGTFEMTKACLELILCLISLGWPRMAAECEMIVGGLAAIWIDQIWIPAEMVLPDKVKLNVEQIKSLLFDCLRLLSVAVDEKSFKSILSQTKNLREMDGFTELAVVAMQEGKQAKRTVPDSK